VSPSESIKDQANVGLMIEDLLTGHMPHHGYALLGRTNTRKATTQWEWRDGESSVYPPWQRGWTVEYLYSRLA
jgi:DNA-binding PadR family transcriptional regulator